MGIFDFKRVSTSDIETLVQLAQASYFPNVLPDVPGTAPPGWDTLVAEDLAFQDGLVRGSFQGNYFVAGVFALFSAAARVMVHRDTENPANTILTVSFQGTDSLLETLLYPEIENVAYLRNFDALMNSVAAYAAAEGIETIWITGHSLGAAAVNELNDVKDTAYGGAYANAVYVSFATPQAFTDQLDILNIGYANDPVFQLVDEEDLASGVNNILYYNTTYLLQETAPSSGLAPIGISLLALLETHNIPNYIDGIDRIISSAFYDEMTRDSFVVVDDYLGPVAALEGTKFFGQPTYFIGSDDDDWIVGGTAADSIEGFDGKDRLLGGGGNDRMLGGDDADVLEGQAGNDHLEGGDAGDRMFGGRGDDRLNGNAGDDFLVGGEGADHYEFDFAAAFGDDTVAFGPFADTLVLIGSGLNEKELKAAYTPGIASGFFDFGDAGTIQLVGLGIGVAFDVSDVVLIA